MCDTLEYCELVDQTEFLTICIHTNGECRITRSGFRGAEYYLYDLMLVRIGDFFNIGLTINIGLYFCQGNGELDFYKPSNEEVMRIADDLSHWKITALAAKDVPNVVSRDGGFSAIPEFYKHRDAGMVKFVPVSVRAKTEIKPLEKDKKFPEVGIGILYN